MGQHQPQAQGSYTVFVRDRSGGRSGRMNQRDDRCCHRPIWRHAIQLHSTIQRKRHFRRTSTRFSTKTPFFKSQSDASDTSDYNRPRTLHTTPIHDCPNPYDLQSLNHLFIYPIKLYTDDQKYAGTNESLDYKLTIFYNICNRARLPREAYMDESAVQFIILKSKRTPPQFLWGTCISTQCRCPYTFPWLKTSFEACVSLIPCFFFSFPHPKTSSEACVSLIPGFISFPNLKTSYFMLCLLSLLEN